MIVNTAIFTCSICGEASHNICAYCTKDACSNHRCERCKRCSDCCECEFPLSAEEPESEIEAIAQPAPEPLEPEALGGTAETGETVFLTTAESSVFVEGSVFTETVEPTETGPVQSLDAIDPDESEDSERH